MSSTGATICVSLCCHDLRNLTWRIEQVADVGDMIEVRVDCFEEGEASAVLEQYPSLRQKAARPFILTFRHPYRDTPNYPFEEKIPAGELAEQVDLWLSHNGFCGDRESTDLADIEAEMFELPEVVSVLPSCRDRIICSFHDFKSMPPDLDQIYDRLAATQSGILKIAVPAADVVDCLPVFDLLKRAEREGRKTIAIAMGPAGVATRILGPSRGSYLTYASFDISSATASGQIDVEEMRELYRIDNIDRQTAITGLIGNPIGHSVSPQIHNAAFGAAKLNAVFIPFEVNDLEAFMQRMVRKDSRAIDWNIRGFSVTAPHKTAVMKHLDWIDPAAREIGAINTIVVQDDSLQGYNTDAAGFIVPLRKKLGSLSGLRCAVMGAGGAARAVVWALNHEGATAVVFARDPGKAATIGSDFSIEVCDLANADYSSFDVVINATPVGMRQHLERETTAYTEQLRGVRVAYDLVYNPAETKFLWEALRAGCYIMGGVEMLVAQAVEQFRLWTGSEPDFSVVNKAARRALAID